MKHIACLLTALIMAGSVISCGASEGETTETQTSAQKADTTASAADSETTAAPEKTSLLDELGEKDLEGYTYTVFDCNVFPDLHVNMPGEEMNGELVNDALFLRDAKLEDLYNCNIEYFQKNDIDILKKLVASGEDAYQLIIHPMGTLMGQATGGNLANLCEVPHLEPDKQWWNPLLYDSLRLKDAMYVTSSDIAPSIYQMPCCLFLNLKLYSDYDFDEDIFQMVIDGKWTYDMLAGMLKEFPNEDVNGDGKWTVEDDMFGLAMHHTNEATMTMVHGLGLQLSQIVDDGEHIECDVLKDEKFANVLDSVKDLFIDISFTEGPGIDINVFSNILFKGNRALFFMHKLESAAVHLRDMEDDYLILPAPKYSEEQETYYSSLSPTGSCFIGVPQTSQANEAAGFLTEALARCSHEDVRPIAFDLVYKEKDTRDPRSAEVLDILLNNLYTDFASVAEFGTLPNILTEVLYDKKPLVSSVQRRQDSIKKAITQFEKHWNPLG